MSKSLLCLYIYIYMCVLKVIVCLKSCIYIYIYIWTPRLLSYYYNIIGHGRPTTSFVVRIFEKKMAPSDISYPSQIPLVIH